MTPVITTAIATAINFRLKFVMISNASSAPKSALERGEELRRSKLSNMGAKLTPPAESNSFAQSKPYLPEKADLLTPFGNTSHGIVHFLEAEAQHPAFWHRAHLARMSAVFQDRGRLARTLLDAVIPKRFALSILFREEARYPIH